MNKEHLLGIALIVLVAACAVFASVALTESDEVTRLSRLLESMQSSTSTSETGDRMIRVTSTAPVMPVSTSTPFVLNKEQAGVATLVAKDGSSQVFVNDAFAKEGRFSMRLPASWGFPKVSALDLTATDASDGEGTMQYVAYQFSSGNPNLEGYIISVIVGDIKKKSALLATPDKRVTLGENGKYLFQGQIQEMMFCGLQIPCERNTDKAASARLEVERSMQTFQLEDR